MSKKERELEDRLQHWGIKGMEWKHKKKKNDDDLKNKISSLISRFKKKAKPVAKKAKKMAEKAAHESKPIVKKAEELAKKQSDHARKKVVKEIAKVKSAAKKKWNGPGPAKPKKQRSYTTDFVGDAKKRRDKASATLSKKQTEAGRDELRRNATSLRKMSEMEYWKKRTKEERRNIKDKAVNDRYKKLAKEEAAKKSAQKANRAKKASAESKYWKDKTKKPKSAKGPLDYIKKYGLKDFVKEEKKALVSVGKDTKKAFNDIKETKRELERIRNGKNHKGLNNQYRTEAGSLDLKKMQRDINRKMQKKSGGKVQTAPSMKDLAKQGYHLENGRFVKRKAKSKSKAKTKSKTKWDVSTDYITSPSDAEIKTIAKMYADQYKREHRTKAQRLLDKIRGK